MPDILTLTLNPALDVLSAIDRVEPTHKLRCSEAVMHPGGGGINVARVLHRLGADGLALYTQGGVTGHELATLLAQEGVPALGLPIAAETRESLSVHENSTGLDYRFVLPGPRLQPDEVEQALQGVARHGATAHYWVLSGSLPPGVPDDLYARIARQAQAQGARLVLDSSGPALRAALSAGVFLFKPSLRELAELVGQPLPGEAEQLHAARQLMAAGQAQAVALTLGEQGALLITPEQAWRAPPLSVAVASTIGAGDSFVGGLVAALASQPDQTGPIDWPAALAMAMATSAASLLHPGTALCQPDDVRQLLPLVQLQAL